MKPTFKKPALEIGLVKVQAGALAYRPSTLALETENATVSTPTSSQPLAPLRPNTEKKIHSVPLEKVVVGDGHRPLDEAHVGDLQPSMAWLGLATPIIVAADKLGAISLVAGQHRVEAARRLGWTHIDAFILDADDPKNRALTISENLHRLGLSVLDRAEQEAEWLQASQQQAAQLAPPAGGRQPHDQGIRKTSLEMKISRRELARAQAIAGMSPEAKLKAREFTLHNNQSALLKIAKGKSADEQLKIAAEILNRKQPTPKSPMDEGTRINDTGLPNFLNRRNPEAAFEALIKAWKAASNLQAAWEDAPLATRVRFAAEVLQVASETGVIADETKEVTHVG